MTKNFKQKNYLEQKENIILHNKLRKKKKTIKE